MSNLASRTSAERGSFNRSAGSINSSAAGKGSPRGHADHPKGHQPPKMTVVRSPALAATPDSNEPISLDEDEDRFAAEILPSRCGACGPQQRRPYHLLSDRRSRCQSSTRRARPAKSEQNPCESKIPTHESVGPALRNRRWTRKSEIRTAPAAGAARRIPAPGPTRISEAKIGRSAGANRNREQVEQLGAEAPAASLKANPDRQILGNQLSVISAGTRVCDLPEHRRRSRRNSFDCIGQSRPEIRRWLPAGPTTAPNCHSEGANDSVGVVSRERFPRRYGPVGETAGKSTDTNDSVNGDRPGRRRPINGQQQQRYAATELYGQHYQRAFRRCPSAMCPAYNRPNEGNASASPTRPSESGSLVSAYTCHATTVAWICVPSVATTRLATYHRKFGFRSET